MKPIYLEFCGINSFSEKAEIDFRGLLAGGVFGIFGDTGSGKSTILDCIHLALYGVIERTSNSMNDCINHNADSAYVIFDFEITTDGVRRTYRVRRERKRKSGTAKASLYEYTVDGKLMALAEGTRDVNVKIEEIIGLNFNDFKMCIALPQGDFAALVKAATAERVKLVSRLFDLEKYGERLTKAVNEKYFKAEEEVRLVEAKMGQNEGGNAEVVAQKTAEIDSDKALLKEAELRVKQADEKYEKACALQKEKEAFDAVCRSIEDCKARLPEMEEKRRQAERLPMAKAVQREAEALKASRLEKAEAEKRQEAALANCQRAVSETESAKKKLTEANFDKDILELSVALEKVNGAAADLQEEAEAEKLLLACRAEYKGLLEACPKRDFEGIRKDLEAKLTMLGEDESLLDYLKRNFKDVLLPETYQEFRQDLKGLAEKHTAIRADVAVLLEKYTPKNVDGKAFDIARIQLAFKETEQKRKLLKTQLENLEREKLAFDTNEKKKELLKEQGRVYGERYERAKAKNEQIKSLGSARDLELRLNARKADKKRAEEHVEAAQAAANKYYAEAEKQKGLVSAHGEMEISGEKALQNALEESGFDSVESALSLLVRLGDEERVKAECKTFFDKYELYKHKYEETDKRKFDGYDTEAVSLARAEKLEAGQARDLLNRKIATGETELARLLELQKKYKEFERELAEKEKRKKLCGELKEILRSNRFLEFIASEYLQEICSVASKTLLSLTNRRFFLRYDKEFKVGDNLDGGNLRAVKTLSGGETFLVSLSLALSLSGAICQKSLRPIEFFFLDEGFGTLDKNLVDLVMDVLGKLSKNFAVGLISHVEELKYRIDNKIIVTGANERHGSLVRIEKF